MPVQSTRVISPRTSASAPLIQVQNLNKIFKLYKSKKGFFGTLLNFVSRESSLVHAVKDISFDIQQGEILAYVGPNGAGKSTTIKMLTGILTPSSGIVAVNGINPHQQRKENARQIGVVFGQRTQLWWDLPLIDSFELLRHVYRIPLAQYNRNLATFRELLDLDPFLQTPVRQLSLGQRMRGDLAAALLHNPPILYLDEPTIGLDVIAKERLRQFIKTINREEKVTVLLTTHDMGDIEQLCQRLLIIDKGSLIYDGDLEQIRQRYGKHRTLIVDLTEPISEIKIEGAETVQTEGVRHWLQFNRDELSAAELIRRVSETYPVLDLSIQEPEIEAIIRHIYEEGVN
jgi:ABC-2 type transport system ATP-binding protein